jgi:uncharacterized protein (TIGR02217 family)
MTEAFHDVLFPLAISFGASGGPERTNEIVRLQSGHEHRNLRHAHSRRRYDVGTGVRSIEEMEQVLDFFEARRGSAASFRFRDPFDRKSCALATTPTPTDQNLGIGDGATRQFPLSKIYGDGPDAYVRPIAKPVVGTVRVAVNGDEISAEQISIDHAAGLVTFAETAVPAAGAMVTAGYEFDVVVRFDTDQLSVNLSSFRAGQIPNIPLVEVIS